MAATNSNPGEIRRLLQSFDSNQTSIPVEEKDQENHINRNAQQDRTAK
jgi:hypothetical protein